MSLCKNTIQKSDITSIPIKLKYSQNITCGGELNVDFYKGVNEFTETGSYSQQFIYYRGIRQLYYMSYLSASLLNSGSAWESFLQSTAASGTYEHDYRYFPTESGASISVLKIPNELFGEKINPETFNFSNQSCTIVDDGNGNLLDAQNENVHVGNIIYSQGVIILTNQNYSEIFPEKPRLYDVYANFNYTDTKIINVLDNNDSGVGIFNTGSVKVFGTPDTEYFKVNSDGTVTLNTEKIGTFTTYYSAYNIYNNFCGIEGDAAKLVVNVNNILNCDFFGSVEQNDCRMTGSIRFNECDLLGFAVVIAPPTPSITPSITFTPSVTKTVSLSRTPTKTPTVTKTATPSISITPSITPTKTVSISRTPTPSISITKTPTPSISVTPYPSTSVGASPSQQPSPSNSVSTSPPNSIPFSQTPQSTPSISVSTTPPISLPPLSQQASSPGPPEGTPTPSITLTPSVTPTVTITKTPSLTITPSAQNFYTVTNNSNTVLCATVYISNNCVSSSGALTQTLFPQTQMVSGSTLSGSSALLPAQGACFRFEACLGSRITSVVINGTIYTTPSTEGQSTFDVCDCTYMPTNGNVNIVINSYPYCVTYYNSSNTPMQTNGGIVYYNCSGSVQSLNFLASGGTFCARYGTVTGQWGSLAKTNLVPC